MKVSKPALPLLILAAVLGSQAWVTQDSEATELLVANHQFEPPIIQHGFQRPTDCCFSYTPRSIRCSFMEDYFVTSSGCSWPAVIFLTKKGKRVCANPRDRDVQDCMRKLQASSKELMMTLS
ncbi:C-C motif chemokine 15 isoform X2 [Nycticebus coucang]|uniref:C-C motif chemokine 15 isoform X2 n=1 Tax=Nycticebus coucang TaxID=9470 RepID=UPI00234CD22C|nr:C-C motif chemokine 15 isoform X2 [Nycticebus coucang]